MANENNNNMSRGGMAAGIAMNQRTTESIIEGLERRYNTQRNIHTVGGTNDDRMAKKEAYIQEQRHQRELDHNRALLELTEKKVKAEKEGQAELIESLKAQIRDVQVKGPGEIGFDVDAVSQNFSSTLEEIALNFSEQTRAEQKAELARLGELKKLIADSNAREKEFLITQLDDINRVAQSEYNKRATIAARALEKSAEMAEQYMDVSSLYAGFVDHNPVMMALWRIGGDFIKRWRVQKKAQREAIARDKVNAKNAAELNERNAQLATDEERRAEEINQARQTILEQEKAAVEARKAQARADIQSPEVAPRPEAPAEPEQTIVRDVTRRPTPVEDDGGDDALDQSFLRDLFGETDEDGDTVDFSVDSASPAPVVAIDDDTPPIPVTQAEPSEEQQAEDKFIRESAAETRRVEREHQLELMQLNSKTFEKLVDIEAAILDGNKIAEQTGKSLERLDGGGGLLEMLGLGKIADLFKGPILKALMMFGPVVAGLSAVLGKIGLSGIGDRLSRGYGDLVERTGGQRPTAKPKPGGRAGGKFQRAKAAGGKFAKAGGGMMARAGGVAARGVGALLGTTAGAVTAAGAVGYGAGTLLNKYVLPDNFKEGLGNVLGTGVDKTLAFFGNDESQRRLETNEKVKEMFNNTKTLGIPEKAPSAQPAANDSKFKREDTGGQSLVVNTDKIESNRVVNNSSRQPVEVPTSEAAEQRLNVLESRVNELNDVKIQAAKSSSILPPVPPRKPTQNVVKSAPSQTQLQHGRTARNSDSSIQRLTDRFVSYGVS